MISSKLQSRQMPALVRRLTMILVLGASVGVFAQGVASAKPSQPAASTAPATTPAAKPAGPSVPSQDQALYLVRATLLTLNDANRSGNYTVLRDLAAPEFQAKNTAADLSQSFSDLRRRNFDLFAAALLTPTFTRPPALDATNRLHLTGFFPTRPQQINFDLMFEVVNGQWRLFGISVATPDVNRPQSQANPAHGKPYYGVRALSGAVGWRW